ncbi:MAG: MarR family transcriptional regulator [Myxococcales bacterium]|nr:MarR family transcriptional regulator [Myxococcales bacterium]
MSAPEGGGVAAWAPEWQLRKRLQDARHVQLLAAATTVFGAMAERDAPFYEVFAQWTLSPLTLDEVNVAFTKRLEFEIASGDERRIQRAMRLRTSSHTRGRLAAAWVVGGGLPRVVHQLFGVLLASDAMRAESDLKAFFDEVTPYFQGRLLGGQLRPSELRVLDAMASSDGPATVSELAKRLDASDSVVSTYVRRLCQASLMEPRAKRVGERASRYELTEPLYRPWRRFRRGRGERAQLVFLAEFVAAMMSERELRAEHLAAVALGVDRPALRVWEEAIELHSRQRHAVDGEESSTPSEDAEAAQSDAWVVEQMGMIGNLLDQDEDVRALEAAQRLWEQQAFLSSVSRLNVRLLVAFAIAKCGHPEDAVRMMDEMLASCEAGAERIGVLLAVARTQRWFGDARRARDFLEQAEREVVEAKLPADSEILEVRLEVALGEWDTTELDEVVARAEEIFRGTPSPRLGSLAAQGRAQIALRERRYDDAIQNFALARDLERRRDGGGQQTEMEIYRAFATAAAGKLEDALHLLELVERNNSVLAPQRRTLVFYRFCTRIMLGRIDAVADLVWLLRMDERLFEKVLPATHFAVQSAPRIEAELCDAVARTLLDDLSARSRSEETRSLMVSLLLHLAIRRGSIPPWLETDREPPVGFLGYVPMMSRIWYEGLSVDAFDLSDAERRFVESTITALSERYPRPSPTPAAPASRDRAVKPRAKRAASGRR